MTDIHHAPGWPGNPARWTSSAKEGVGTARSLGSPVWFTISHGILNEVYYPRPDQACLRDLGLLVTDGHTFFSEEKRHATHHVRYPVRGVPAYHLVNEGQEGRYRIDKTVVASADRPVVLQRVRFAARQGAADHYHLYALLAPHLGNQGGGNTAWLGEVKGRPMLLAERDGYALALACSVPWRGRSAGFVGISDGWQDVYRHRQLTWHYDRAENGNVALIGEIDLAACSGEFVLSLGFGRHALEAGHHAAASLLIGFDQTMAEYAAGWQDWQCTLLHLEEAAARQDEYRVSTAVLRTHEAKEFRGGMIASLSVPWGFAKGDNDLGGYHLVWSRDLVESIGGLLAAGAHDDALRAMRYLETTQEADGHWPQNMWLDGTPYWGGVQMDETGFPLLLVALAWREGAFSPRDLPGLWPMVRRAAGYLARNGPVTQEDRWEEDPGYSPFTLAVEVAALLAAADIARRLGEPAIAQYLEETADAWNASIERWTYATGTPLADRLGIDGYYVRIAPVESGESSSPLQGYVPIKNQPPTNDRAPASKIVSPDALALVRFGLRDPHDRRIENTVRAIDEMLRVETPHGPAWRRYNGDGYGEHADGTPFDGTGIGRPWPLLVGERAHYELAAGRPAEARRLLGVMEKFANAGGMIPEQVWDGPAIPSRELSPGQPSGSAMPLVWAHAEYVKLCRSLREGQVFDMLPQPRRRYAHGHTSSPLAIWRFNHKSRRQPAGATLRLEVLAPATVHWSDDNWRTAHDTQTTDTGLGVHIADLPTNHLGAGSEVVFTFRWQNDRWEGSDYRLSIVAPAEYAGAVAPPAREPAHAG